MGFICLMPFFLETCHPYGVHLFDAIFLLGHVTPTGFICVAPGIFWKHLAPMGLGIGHPMQFVVITYGALF
jgi:hypothetical protein